MNSRILVFLIAFAWIGTLFAADNAERRLEARKEKFPIFGPARLMVENFLLPQKGLENPAVIDAMMRIPRHLFVLPEHQRIAYRDQAIAIGEGQTISPPYVVAYMTEKLEPKPADKVLEIGTGSGYQAAVLALLVDQVYSIEIVKPLGEQAEKRLDKLGFDNVNIRVGDGFKGWVEAAPFDSIIVTCSPENVPQALVDQLREGGRMIIPLGERYQQAFYLCRKVDGKLVRERLTPTLFVPMTGAAEEKRQVKPDGKNPKIIGGGFEETRKDGTPVGWHYTLNATVVPYDAEVRSKLDALAQARKQDIEIPEGKSLIRFVSKVEKPKPVEQTPEDSVLSSPQSFAQILQGFAVDGREVRSLSVAYTMRGRNVVPLQARRFQTPTGILRFFDESRNQIGEILLGRTGGTFDWKRIRQEINVPREAREAILLIGLPLASGELDVDHVAVQKGTL